MACKFWADLPEPPVAAHSQSQAQSVGIESDGTVDIVKQVNEETGGQTPMPVLTAFAKLGILQLIPRDATGTLTSVGSVLHATGRCRPCSFRARGRDCIYGAVCTFCHAEEHQGDGHMRPQVSKQMRLRVRRWRALQMRNQHQSENIPGDISTAAPEEELSLQDVMALFGTSSLRALARVCPPTSPIGAPEVLAEQGELSPPSKIKLLTPDGSNPLQALLLAAGSGGVANHGDHESSSDAEDTPPEWTGGEARGDSGTTTPSIQGSAEEYDGNFVKERYPTIIARMSL